MDANNSLALYTKMYLLETENAYYCVMCDKKVDTVKRVCVNLVCEGGGTVWLSFIGSGEFAAEH